MAKVTTISVTYGRKFNLGDYNSAHIEISIWADLDLDEDDPQVVTEELYKEAKRQVKDQALPLIANQKAEIERAFLGLPTDVQNQIMEGYKNGN